MLHNKAVILVKAEAQYGVDSNPAGNLNAIVTSVPELNIIGEKRARNIVMGSFGKAAPFNVGEGIEISFDTELKTGGAAGTVPAIGPLLVACGFIEDPEADTNVTYTLASNPDGGSVTIYYHQDGIRHKITGCRGTFGMKGKTGEQMILSFKLTGLYSGTHASDTAFLAPVFASEAVAKIIMRAAVFTIDNYAAVIENFELDLGNTITKRPDANAATGVKAYSITDREVKGSVDPEVVALATYNPWDKWDKSTPGDISLQLGEAAGNKVKFTVRNCIKDVPKYGNRNNIQTYQLGFTAHPAIISGNNELEIVFE